MPVTVVADDAHRSMLRPSETATRECRSLDGLWRFALDGEGAGREEDGGRTGSPSDAMPVPASFNDIVPDPEARDHVGDVWYQRTVRVPRGGTASGSSCASTPPPTGPTVWVGDAQVVEHEGGYTPFEADVTEHVAPGEEARVTVVGQQRAAWTSIPPGTSQELDDGRRVQQYFHDFFNYAGLHRSVWLHTTPRVHVSDVTVARPSRRHGRRRRLPGGRRGRRGHEVRVVVRDADGAEVARADGSEGTLRIDGVQLWRPGAGYLYTLEIELLGADGELVDVYPQPFGVRTVAVDGHRFLINGEPFHFTGFGKHEDFADPRPRPRPRGHGPRLRAAQWIGANSFRTSHYPYDEAVLDYADRHGIVVIDETAAVGLNLNTGTRHPRPGRTADDLQRGRRSARAPRRSTGRRSASSSPATRTTPAW